jgi:hypothetical protein
MIPKKPLLDLIGDGYRFSGKITLKQKARWRGAGRLEKGKLRGIFVSDQDT